MSTKLTYIPDGYTEPFRIKAAHGLHGELCGTFRRLTPAQRDAIYTNIDQHKNRPSTYNGVVAKMLAEQVQSWDATDDKGQAVAISPANVARLEPTLYDRLYSIVMSRSPSVPAEDDDGDHDNAVDPYIAQLEQSQTEGRPLPQIQQEAAAKN